MNDVRHIIVPAFGAASATAGALSPLTVVQIVCLCLGGLCAAISLIQAAIQTVAAVRRHLRGEATAEETVDELEKVKQNLQNVEKGVRK